MNWNIANKLFIWSNHADTVILPEMEKCFFWVTLEGATNQCPFTWTIIDFFLDFFHGKVLYIV